MSARYWGHRGDIWDITLTLTLTCRLSHVRASARESSAAAGEAADGAAPRGEGGISSGEAAAATPSLRARLPAGDRDRRLRLLCCDRPEERVKVRLRVRVRANPNPNQVWLRGRPGDSGRRLRVPCLDRPGERPGRLPCRASACMTRGEAGPPSDRASPVSPPG